MKYVLMVMALVAMVGCKGTSSPSYCATASTAASVVSPIFMMTMGCDMDATKAMLLETIKCDRSEAKSLDLSPIIKMVCLTALNAVKSDWNNKLIVKSKCNAEIVTSLFTMANTDSMCEYLINLKK